VAGTSNWLETLVDATNQYQRERDRYEKLARKVAETAQDALSSQTDVRFKIDWRAKQPRSLLEKLTRKRSENPNRFADKAPAEVLDLIRDLAGVRVLTYVDSDRSKVLDVLHEVFGGKDAISRIVHEEKKDEPGVFYRATHLDIVLDAQQLSPDEANIAETVCEIQVSSLLAHAANEIEHDLVYKPSTGQLSVEETELLEGLGALTVAGDKYINQLLRAVSRRQLESTGPFQDQYDFVVRLRKLIDLPRLEVHASQLFAELMRLGLDAPSKLKSVLFNGKTWRTDTEAELTAFNASIAKKASEEQLDAETSDLVLMRLLQSQCEKIVAGHPLGRGMGRPSRLVYIAKHYAAFCKARTKSGAAEDGAD
jgi:ppGpp synthetase/RelA/SpoT-type nucleotidyltranferase